MIKRFLLTLCCLGAFARPDCVAADDERFEVLPGKIEIPERGAVSSFVLVTDTLRFNFIPPADSTVEVDKKARKLKLTPPDKKCLITFQVTAKDPALLKQPGQIALHDEVQQRYTNAPVTQALPCSTGIGLGCSFDVEQMTAAKTRLTTRIAFVPFPNGMAEVSLTTSTTNFSKQYFRFAQMLTSLHSESVAPGGLKRSQKNGAQEVGR